MTSADNFVSNRQVSLHGLNETPEIVVKPENLLDTKLQDVGCCGDVPKMSKANNKKRDKLLEWLKSSQLKREENNRQVFSRWIDMVDNGAIDLTSLSNYPGKASKPVNNFTNLNTTAVNGGGQPIGESSLSQMDPTVNVSTQISKTMLSNAAKPTVIPTSSICPPYFPPINNTNYYGMSQNWFSGNQASAVYSPLQIPSQIPISIYPGYGSYCAASPLVGNYYQYVPIQQTCTLCPPYVMPTLAGGDPGYPMSPSIQMQTLSTPDNSPTVNIDVNKWFDVLNEININQTSTENSEDSSFQNDSNNNIISKDKS